MDWCGRAWELETRHAPPGAVRVGVTLLVEHLLVFAAFHRPHSVAAAGVCLAAARQQQGKREPKTETDCPEEVVFLVHSCVFPFNWIAVVIFEDCLSTHRASQFAALGSVSFWAERDSVVAAGYAKDGDDEGQRHQSGPYPL